MSEAWREVLKPSALAKDVVGHFGSPQSARTYRWTKGASYSSLPDLQIVEMTIGSRTHYVTAGASAILDQPGYGTEFCLIVREPSHSFVELMAMVAYLHSLPEHRLDVGHTMSIGRPIVDSSVLDRLLVSLPYPYGSEFEFMHTSDGEHVRFLWLVPIGAREERFRHDRDLEALEARFEAQELDFADLARPEVV
jgi:hypothetical protein